ncbi:MAG TPA: ShlB/FhaC/HecB family hemolysin secretion/activation protein [Burkholderiaceae bacterium]|mgnify:CR=1 FL=1|nr:ShlB/FhaC/HecB family hemolysin secretion/activation protein [Burkholderiaceae bacterium]
MRHTFQLATCAVWVMGIWAGGAFAQVVPTAAGTVAATESAQLIRGFSVTGSNPLADGEVNLVLAPFLRKPATLDNLQKATASLEALLREKGFGLHRVVLPPQDVDHTITLHLVQFTMGTIDVEGAAAFHPANVRASVPELTEGGTPNLERLAIQTALANENGSKNIQVALRAGDKPDQIDATIKVQDAVPLKLSANLNNTGSKQSGRDRFTLAASHDNLFDRDHQLIGAYTTSLAKPSAVTQLGLTYRVPLYSRLSMVDVSYTQSDVVGDFGTFSSTGAGHALGIGIMRHVQTPQGMKRYVQLGLEDKAYKPTLLNGIPLAGQVQRRVRPLSLGYFVGGQSADTRWDVHGSLAINLPGGRGNSVAAYQSESPAVTRARWTALRVRGNWATGLGEGWSLAWRGQMQWSPDALIAGEQLGLGGYASLRGTEERALSGDRGFISSLEVGSPEWVPGFRGVAFWDAGWVSSQATAARVLPANDRAASVGLGVRYSRTPFALMLDVGRVVSGSKAAVGSSTVAPRSGDYKVHLSVTARY